MKAAVVLRTLLLAALCGAIGPAARAATPPNVLLITADDLHWDSLGCFGCPVDGTTPNLDALAVEGRRYTNAYVPIALCTPSRHVILSGSHSHQTATRCFTPIQRHGPTMPDALKAAGYLIANINKQQDDYGWDIAIVERDNGFGREVPAFAEGARRVFDAAAGAGRPFFLMANINDPHRPFSDSEAEAANRAYAPHREAGRFTEPSRVYRPDEVTVPGFLPDLPEVRMEMAQYYSSVRRMDDLVGAMLAELEASGRRDDTIVVFLSDHGVSMPYSKMNCYKASLRTPVLVRWPGAVEAGSTDDRLISSVDLAPTLLEAVGLDAPSSMAGTSFEPSLRGGPCVARDTVIGYYYRNLRQDVLYPTFAVHTERYAYVYNPWVDGAKEVHNSDYTNSPTLNAMWRAAETNAEIAARVEHHKHRVLEEFYDYDEDPYARENRLNEPAYAEPIARMRQALADWMATTTHPAERLIKTPYDEKLRRAYLAYEVQTARLRLAELDAARAAARVAKSGGRP